MRNWGLAPCIGPHIIKFLSLVSHSQTCLQSQSLDDDEDYTNGSISPLEQMPPAGRGRGKKVALSYQTILLPFVL